MSTYVEGAKDYYLAHPPLQPKREIAEYVKTEGIATPRRFKDLDVAIISGRPFIIRSEHPQDYTSASGIALSLIVTPRDLNSHGSYPFLTSQDWENFFNTEGRDNTTLLSHIHRSLKSNILDLTQNEVETGITNLSLANIRRYCYFSGQNLQGYLSELSYSYWEMLPGTNRAIVADNTIAGRYHIFTNETAYHIVENGKIVAGPSEKVAYDIHNFPRLINFYESIRHLKRFDGNHCPLVEIQTTDQNHDYFLQYLRVRDFKPAGFQLERKPHQDEVETLFVRGATPSQGMEVVINMRYQTPLERENLEEGGYEEDEDPGFSEAILPSRKLQIIHQQPERLYMGGGHYSRSQLIKPEISAVLEPNSVIKLLGEVSTLPVQQQRVYILSDGRRAFLRAVA